MPSGLHGITGRDVVRDTVKVPRSVAGRCAKAMFLRARRPSGHNFITGRKRPGLKTPEAPTARKRLRRTSVATYEGGCRAGQVGLRSPALLAHFLYMPRVSQQRRSFSLHSRARREPFSLQATRQSVEARSFSLHPSARREPIFFTLHASRRPSEPEALIFFTQPSARRPFSLHATSFFALPDIRILPTRASTLKCFQDFRHVSLTRRWPIVDACPHSQLWGPMAV